MDDGPELNGNARDTAHFFDDEPTTVRPMPRPPSWWRRAVFNGADRLAEGIASVAGALSRLSRRVFAAGLAVYRAGLRS